MTQGPDTPPEQPEDQQQPPWQQPHPQQPHPQQPWAQQPAPPPYGQPQPGYYPGAVPGAPYGIHPGTGIPYSEKSKIVAGVLQIVVPLGIGRFYIGDTGIGVAQLLVTILTCGIGALWPFIDGIIILATDSKDSQGLVLRT